MPSRCTAPSRSLVRLGTSSADIGARTPSSTARIMTGSSICTTDQYGSSPLPRIFSGLTVDLVPSNSTVAPCFASKFGITISSIHAVWLAAQPTTISLVWARTIGGAASAKAPAAALVVQESPAVDASRRCRGGLRSAFGPVPSTGRLAPWANKLHAIPA